ncbi:MAG: hypothetical protein IKQ60_07755 [Candidatus Methanomethylophilaceae archaeon]|nr:hypothetical protein [Candidatus Methanomethylophilaceae archaeon]
MGASAEKDLGTMLGDPRKAVLTMSVPLIVSYLVVQANSFADASWCSGLGVDASSAVAAICPIYWILNGLGAGIGVGTSAVVSRRLALGRRGSADGAAASALAISLLMALACIPAMLVLLDPCISWLGADDIREECASYILPVIALSPFNVLSGTLAGTLRGEGAARKTMLMMSAAAVANMVLDPLLIYGLGMGLFGAGLATAASSAVSCAMCAFWYLRGSLVIRPGLSGISGQEAATILRAGAPRAVEYFLVYFMSMVQRVLIISGSGTTAVAYYSMTWMYVSLACVISLAIGAALVPVCSAALARKDAAKADAAIRYSCRICVVSMAAIAVALFLVAEAAVVPFTYSETMAPLRSKFAWVLRVYCTFIPVIGLIDVGSSMLQAMGRPNVSLASSFVRNLIIIALLAATAGMSPHSVFYSLAASELIGTAIMIVPAWLLFEEYKRAGRLRRRVWRRRCLPAGKPFSNRTG